MLIYYFRRWWNRRQIAAAKAYMAVYYERRCQTAGFGAEFRHWENMEMLQVKRINAMT